MEGGRDMACPDPSAHNQHNKLSEQASTAALYATNPARRADPSESALGPDGKLSSKSAAASLKYARPQDLPSYPSSGLGNADSAGKAAMLAKDYKMKDLWHPELSAAGSKAALLAHQDGGKLDLWQPTASKAGNSAATLAMRTKGLSPELDRGYTADGKQRALLAATLSISRSGVAPSPVAPLAYPDSKNAASNALNAATKSHRANSVRTAAEKRQPDGWNSEAMQAARVQNLGANMSPEMFTEHPPVAIEREEKAHNAALRASAVSMAKQMYDIQNRTVLGPDLRGGVEGAGAATARQQPSSQLDVKQEALRYIHLQDAAHKLAQERLAKVDKTFEAAKYREYYGYPDNPSQQQSSPKKTTNRLSMRSKGRRRATSDGVEDADFSSDDDDEGRAQRIRSQMNQLNTGVAGVDEKKRAADRAKVYAAAEKKVHAQMHNLDEKVFADTGKVPPAMMEEWEAKARARAVEEKREKEVHPGQTHIGGGKYVSTAEIERIAAERLRPTLEGISAEAERRRERDREIKEGKEEAERERREEKDRVRGEKEEGRRMRNEEKASKKQYNEEAKARKSLDQRRSREVKREPAAVAADDDAEDGIEAEPKADKKRSTTLGRITSRLRRNRKTGDEPAAATAAKEGVVPPGTDAVSEVEDYEHLPAPLPSSSTHPVAAETDAGLLASRPGHVGVEDSSEDEWDEAADEHEGAGMGTAAVGGVGAPKSEAEAIQHAFAVTDQTKHEDTLAEKGKRAFGFGEPAVQGGAGVVAGAAREIGFGAGPGAGAGAGAVVLASSSYVVGEPGLESVASGAVDPCGEGGEDVTEHVGGLHKTLTANRLDPRVPLEAVAAGGALGGGGLVASGSSDVIGLGGNDAVINPVGDERKLGGEAIAPVTDTVTPLDGATAVDPIDSPAKPETNTLQARETPATGEKETESKGLRGFFGKFRKDKGATKEPGRITSSAGKYGGETAGPMSAAGGPATATGATTGIVASDTVTTGQPASDPVPAGLPTSAPGGLVGVGGAGAGAGAGAAGNGSAEPRAVSPSSFRRRSGALDDLSSVSSSGAEEEGENPMQRRGRSGFGKTTGRDGSPTTTTGEPEKKGSGGLMGFLGFGGGKGKEGKAGGDGEVVEDGETDQFEEARDHFDEGLAPAPAFAAGVGGKGRGVGSPVRETRFREDV
ncbi:Eisosome assembly protein [Friedmanniomyces endolithicus]|uniref:Eisosome assembly protein n=1 Tax=Friedmanniomyces endolithicus TaxID=329885 RepID=A0AAN6FIE8_9PEZI|nr:Eisosome assembly protein [Friedmanniomyces endolithicus]KAK0275631.1 Eisosome assembly protein [Friedmanniomyces endolithicus]KAK0316150.1 Eisosome assembly protein [Friedmanniomyces endolithicus]KAK0992580.1 Eisosome assembly protein [Friedmanniomyces endolithicus]